MRRLLILLFCLVSTIQASTGAKQPSQNAALRYWMAFALMNDSTLSKEETAKLEAVVTGSSPWDEAQFGALVDQNNEALRTMIRGSHLSYCDWGIEYSLGPDAPVAYLPKARTLARLNVLYARRLASQGNYDAATEALTAGIRFAQHLSQNASFFGALMAKTAFGIHLAAIKQLADGGHFSRSNIVALQNSVRALPNDGLDWGSAAKVEAGAIHQAMLTLSHSTSPESLYTAWFSRPAPRDFRAPDTKNIAALDGVMTTYAEVLTLPSSQAQSRLISLNQQIAKADPVGALMVPNPTRMLAARTELISAVQDTKTALAKN